MDAMKIAGIILLVIGLSLLWRVLRVAQVAQRYHPAVRLGHWKVIGKRWRGDSGEGDD